MRCRRPISSICSITDRFGEPPPIRASAPSRPSRSLDFASQALDCAKRGIRMGARRSRHAPRSHWPLPTAPPRGDPPATVGARRVSRRGQSSRSSSRAVPAHKAQQRARTSAPAVLNPFYGHRPANGPNSKAYMGRPPAHGPMPAVRDVRDPLRLTASATSVLGYDRFSHERTRRGSACAADCQPR